MTTLHREVVLLLGASRQFAAMGWLCLKLTSLSGPWSVSRVLTRGLTAKCLIRVRGLSPLLPGAL